MLQLWPHSPWITWAVLPPLVFLARILGYGVGAIRISALSGRRRFLAAELSFFEIAIWIVVIFQMCGRLSDPLAILACALGFAAGTYVGLVLQDALSGGSVVLRMTTAKPAEGLILSLGSLGVGVTIFEAEGSTGSVNQLVIVVNRKVLPKVLAIMERYFSKAFFTIEEIAYVSEGARLGSRRRSPRARASRSG